MNTELTASTGKPVGKSERLMGDIKIVAADVDAVLKDKAATGFDKLSGAGDRIEQEIGKMKCRLDDACHSVSDRAKGAADLAQVYVKGNPWKIIGVAAAVGVVIGLLRGRR